MEVRINEVTTQQEENNLKEFESNIIASFSKDNPLNDVLFLIELYLSNTEPNHRE